MDRLQSPGQHAVIERWQEFAPWLGREITVRRSDSEVVGIAQGVDSAGRLYVRDAQGEEIVVVAGDVLDLPDDRPRGETVERASANDPAAGAK